MVASGPDGAALPATIPRRMGAAMDWRKCVKCGRTSMLFRHYRDGRCPPCQPHRYGIRETLVILLAACAGGLSVSTDRGERWTTRTDGLDARYSRAVAVCGDAVLVLASNGPRGGNAAVYRGPLAGGAFERSVDGLPPSFDDYVDTYCLEAFPDGSFAAFGRR